MITVLEMYQYFEFGNKYVTIGEEEYSTSWGERQHE